MKKITNFISGAANIIVVSSLLVALVYVQKLEIEQETKYYSKQRIEVKR